jgi:hypothetical protein
MNVNPKENILKTASGNTPREVPEFTTNSASKVVKISGILTSNLRTRISSNTPYMAFFRADRDCQKHPLPFPLRGRGEECEASKCQDCEIPVVFRTKCCLSNYLECDIPLGGLACRNQLTKPKLKKDDKVLLEGEFSNSKDSNRPSFTCYDYQIIAHE